VTDCQSRFLELDSKALSARVLPRFDTHASLVVILTLVVFGTSGCGGKRRLTVSPVSGQVLYRGNGVAGATIIFHPLENVPDDAKKMRPYAFADADGHFQLKTYVDGDGVPAGDYRVSIVFAGVGMPARRQEGSVTGPPGATHVPMPIPLETRKKYSNVDTAGIAVTVHEGENQLAPIELK